MTSEADDANDWTTMGDAGDWMFGMIHPPGSSGPYADCPRLYFSQEFLRNPLSWCTVELPEGYIEGQLPGVPYWTWPKGTRITHEFPHHKRAIWLLTGLFFPLTTTVVYEGKWPD